MSSHHTRYLFALLTLTLLAACGEEPDPPLSLPEDNQQTALNQGDDDPADDDGAEEDNTAEEDNATEDGNDDTAHLRELSEDEQALYDAINAHRESIGLAEIPLSPSLTVVARTHVQDQLEHGNEVLVEGCNLHSWSDHGDWTGCCYTPDHAEARCMWDKPRELTLYQNTGYEISAFGVQNPQHALNLWLGSTGHRPVIENSGAWADYPWQAIGVGIEDGIAHVWVGVESDPTNFLQYY